MTADGNAIGSAYQPLGELGLPGGTMRKSERSHRFTTPSGIRISIIDRGIRGWFLNHRAPWMTQSDRRLLSKGNRDSAIRAAIEYTEELYRKHAVGPTPSVSEMAKQLIAHKQREGRSPDYTRKINEHVKKFIGPAIGEDTAIGNVTAKELIAFRAKLGASDLDHQTVNRILTSLRQIFKYAEENGDIIAPALPRNFGTPPWKNRERWQILEPSEISKLLRKAPDEVRPLFGYVANTGLRIGSALATERSWIDFGRHVVRYPASAMKGRYPHVVDLNSSAETFLRQACDRGGAKPFDYSYWFALDFWVQLRKELGRPKLRIHDLRHSFVSNQLAAGTPIHVVQQMAAHRSLAVTALYAHASDEARRLAAGRVEIE
jgi:integrase